MSRYRDQHPTLGDRPMARSFTYADIRQRLSHIQGGSFSAIVFRTASPRYSDEREVLSGIGALKGGGRWNPKGIAAVYCSVTPEAALAETFALQRYYNWPDHSALPRVMVGIEVELVRVLNLTDGAVRKRLQISQARMLETDWRAEVADGLEPLTQTIGQAAFDSRFEAIQVQSATELRAPNLVIFPGNLSPQSWIKLTR